LLRYFETTVTGINKVTNQLKAKEINDGASALKKLGLAVIGFAAMIVLASPLIIIAALVALPILAVIAGISFVYKIIGSSAKDIKKGAKALLEVSLSMVALSVGILALTFVSMINPVATLLGIGFIALTGLVFGIIGKFDDEVIDGAFAIGLVSISILVFTGAMWLWQKAKIDFVKSVLPLAGAVLILGVVWALAGAAIEFIAPGALAVALIGLSIWVLGMGLKKLMDVKFNKDQMEQFGNTAKELIKVYALAGLASPLILLGSGAFLGMGASLYSIAKGIDAISKVNLTSFDPTKLAQIITGISGAFAIAGSTNGQSGNLLTWLTGVELGPNNVERGIKSVLHAGEALTSISSGLKNFMRDAGTFNFNSKDPNSVTYKIEQVTTMISRVFAGIGKSANQSDSLWKHVFGTDFRKSDVENGIAAVRNSGDTLAGIAKGLSEWKNLDKFHLTPADFQIKQVGNQIVAGGLMSNIALILNAVRSVFGEIGKAEQDGKHNFFGFHWGEGDVERGINAVQGSGKELADIAASIAIFGKYNPQQIMVVSGNIRAIILSIPKAFIEAANIIKGREESIKGLSNFLKGAFSYIAEGISDIQKNFENKADTKGYIGRLGDDIANLLKQMTDKANPNTLVNFGKFASVIQTLAKNQDPFAKFQKSFGMFTKDMKTFAESFGKIDADKFDKFSTKLNYTNTNSTGDFTMLKTPTPVPTVTPTGNQVFKSTPTPVDNSFVGKAKSTVKDLIDAVTGNSPAPDRTPNAAISAPTPVNPTQSPIDYALLTSTLVDALKIAQLQVIPANPQQWSTAFHGG
jgi:hypothetical protein